MADRVSGDTVHWKQISFNTLAVLIVCTSVYVVLRPVFSSAKVPDHRRSCPAKLKSLSTAFAIYGSDHNEHLPLSRTWIDALWPCTRSDIYFDASDIPEGSRYGYAMSSRLSGARLDRLPNRGAHPLLYDSTSLYRNATDAITSLPVPGRHNGVNHVLYDDGRIESQRR
jgi:hypothetical protein